MLWRHRLLYCSFCLQVRLCGVFVMGWQVDGVIGLLRCCFDALRPTALHWVCILVANGVYLRWSNTPFLGSDLGTVASRLTLTAASLCHASSLWRLLYHDVVVALAVASRVTATTWLQAGRRLPFRAWIHSVLTLISAVR